MISAFKKCVFFHSTLLQGVSTNIMKLKKGTLKHFTLKQLIETIRNLYFKDWLFHRSVALCVFTTIYLSKYFIRKAIIFPSRFAFYNWKH